MSTSTQLLLNLIKANPGIHLARLADRADCDVDTVHFLLVDAISRGEILSEKTDGPNGHKTYAFSCNPTFLGWSRNEALVAKDGVNIDGAHSAVAIAPTVSKIDKALAYLRKHGEATPHQLASAMDIDPKYSASQYVSTAIKSGQIVRAGNLYRLGAADVVASGKVVCSGEVEYVAKTSSAAAENDTQAPPALTIPRFSQAPLPTPVRPAKPAKSLKPARSIPSTATAGNADTVSSSLHVGGFQIMVWQRSGHMVLSAHDNTVDLAPEHVRALSAFMTLIAATPQS